MNTKTFFHERETETPQQRATRQWQAVQTLLAEAVGASAEFQTRLATAGIKPQDIGSLDDFAAIPVLRKKDLSRLQQEKGLEWFLTVQPGQLSRIYQSPGPIYDPEGLGPDFWGWTEAFFAAGFRRGDLVQMTFSYHLTPAGLMLEEPLRTLGCGVIPAGPGNTDIQLQLLQDLPVTGFVGMTSFLKILGEKTLKNGLDPKKVFRLKTAFVAAERLTETLRTEVQDMFGLRICQGYGTADVGCIAHECLDLGGMHLSSRCLVEICDPQTGRPLPPGSMGEVVVTPLTTGYPLIRLATGDLSRLLDTPCACGRTAPKLQGILGRVDDTAKVRGQFVYPAQVAKMLAKFPEIVGHQVVLDNPAGKDRLILRLKISEAVDPQAVDTKAIAARFQDGIKLRPAIMLLDPGETLGPDAAALVDNRTYDEKT